MRRVQRKGTPRDWCGGAGWRPCRVRRPPPPPWQETREPKRLLTCVDACSSRRAKIRQNLRQRAQRPARAPATVRRGRASAAGRDGARVVCRSAGRLDADAWVCYWARRPRPVASREAAQEPGRRAAEHLDAVTAGDREHVHEVRWPRERRGPKASPAGSPRSAKNVSKPPGASVMRKRASPGPGLR